MEKKRIVESLQSIKEELSDVTIPLYEQSYKTFSKKRFKDSEVNQFEKEMANNVKSFRNNHLFTILNSMKNASKTIDALIIVFNNYKEDKIYKDGMSILTANQLQYSELSSFVAGYSRRWLLFLYTLETSVDKKAGFKGTDEYIRESEYLNKNKQSFFSGVGILSKPHKEVDKSFKSIPDISVDPDSPVDPSITVGSSKVDPMQFGLVPRAFHFIYHIRMAYTNWQLKRHTLMVEEKRQLELKMLMLKELRDDNTVNDPKLEKQIESGENRIEKLRYEINRLEEAENA